MASPRCEELVERAAGAQRTVARLELDERLERVRGSRAALEAAAPTIMETALRESGQTIRFARREIESALALLDTLPQFAEAIRPRRIPAVSGMTRLEWAPYGVVYGWHAANSPVWVPTVVAASALVAGNAIIGRPSRRVRETSASVLSAIAAPWPDDAVQIADIDREDADDLICHPGVHAVVVHGSTATCRRHLTRLAHAYSSGIPMRPYIPEASGNDPALVLRGADLAAAAGAIVVGAFTNAGQLCMSVKRIIVERSVWEEFEPLLVARVAALRLGDPAHEGTDVPPLGDGPGRGRARTALAEALALGGQVVTGEGERGPFFTPTVVMLPKDAAATILWSEESFAPLRGLMLADDIDDAVALANAGPYGLGAVVFASDAEAVGELRAARVVLNGDPLYHDPHFVVGGVGDSGLQGARPKLEQLVYARRVHVG